MVAATTLPSTPPAPGRAHRRVSAGRKTRVGVCGLALAPSIGARARRSRGAHSGKSREVRQHASAISVFENWNRYYDPFTGRYLQPEPVLKDPWWLERYAKAGHSLPTYSYAANNPVHYTDPTGRIFPIVIPIGIAISEILIPAVIAGVASAAFYERECETDKFRRCNKLRSMVVNMCKRAVRQNAKANWGKPGQPGPDTPVTVEGPFGSYEDEPVKNPLDHPDVIEALAHCEKQGDQAFRDCMKGK